MSADLSRPTDAIKRLVEVLRFHDGDTRSVDQLAEETGLSWAETYNYSQLIETILAIAPEVSMADGGEVAVGDWRTPKPPLYEDDELVVLAYLFAHTRTNDPVDIETHAAFFDDHADGIDAAIDDGYVDYDGDADTLALTLDGLTTIAPRYSRLIHKRD